MSYIIFLFLKKEATHPPKSLKWIYIYIYTWIYIFINNEIFLKKRRKRIFIFEWAYWHDRQQYMTKGSIFWQMWQGERAVVTLGEMNASPFHHRSLRTHCAHPNFEQNYSCYCKAVHWGFFYFLYRYCNHRTLQFKITSLQSMCVTAAFSAGAELCL